MRTIAPKTICRYARTSAARSRRRIFRILVAPQWMASQVAARSATRAMAVITAQRLSVLRDDCGIVVDDWTFWRGTNTARRIAPWAIAQQKPAIQKIISAYCWVMWFKATRGLEAFA